MITLHGSNKLPGELDRAVTAGVGHIVVDSFDEIGRLTAIAERTWPTRRRAAPRVLVRVTTGVEAAAHEFVATAHDDQKFGFSLASGAADEAVRQVLAAAVLEFAGLHSHIGSQIYDTAGFEVAAHRVLELAVRIRASRGIEHRRAEPGRRLRHRVHAGRRPGRHQGRRAEPAGDPGLAVPRGGPAPAPADRRAGPGHRRAGHGHAVRGRHREGRGRAADLRQHGRRHERQHPHRAVRRRVHLRAGLSGVRRGPPCCAGWSAGTARAGTSWSGTRTCRATWPWAT